MLDARHECSDRAAHLHRRPNGDEIRTDKIRLGVKICSSVALATTVAASDAAHAGRRLWPVETEKTHTQQGTRQLLCICFFAGVAF